MSVNFLLTTMSTKSRLNYMVNQVGKLIRQERLKQGLSERQLEEILGIDHTYIHKIEKGERLLNEKQVLGVAKWLGKPWDYLLNMVEDDRREIKRRKILAQALEISPEEGTSPDAIASNDRRVFLTLIGRETINFPDHWKRIPRELFGLYVIEEDAILGANDSLIYAGLFVGRHKYQQLENAIVVAKKYVKMLGSKTASPSLKTKVFHVLHELGHYRLHWLMKEDQSSSGPMSHRPLFCSSGDRSPKEEQANLYASAFLMPRSEIFQIAGGRKSINWQRESKRLCESFFVEPYMLKFRLQTLGIRIV